MTLISFAELTGKSADLKKERRAKWKHLRPRNALIYVENRCHMKCDHCYESSESHPPAHGMSLDEYKKLFDELADLGVLRLTLTGGEVFLRRDLFEIIAAARERRFDVELFTSGTHIDETKAKRLKELNVSKVEITIYSHMSNVHDDFTHIPGSHGRSVAALRYLHEAGVATALKANLMTFNIDHIDGLIELAESLNATWSLDPTVKPKMNGDRSPLRFALSPDVLRKKVLSRPELYSAFRRLAPDDLCDGRTGILTDGDHMCGAGRGTLAIGADGGVLPCGFFPTAAGNIKEESLDDIWFSSSFMDDVREQTFGKMTACTSCDVKSSCGPCMAYSVVESGDIGGCATSSRQLAEAATLLAQKKVQKNTSMERGRGLPLLNDAFEVPMNPPRLNTEP